MTRRSPRTGESSHDGIYRIGRGQSGGSGPFASCNASGQTSVYEGRQKQQVITRMPENILILADRLAFVDDKMPPRDPNDDDDEEDEDEEDEERDDDPPVVREPE